MHSKNFLTIVYYVFCFFCILKVIKPKVLIPEITDGYLTKIKKKAYIKAHVEEQAAVDCGVSKRSIQSMNCMGLHHWAYELH